MAKQITLKGSYSGNKDKVEVGVDEAGRGALCGPVTVAACIMPFGFQHPLIKDSKLLNEGQRVKAREVVLQNAIAYSVVHISPEEIDNTNILRATLRGMNESLKEVYSSNGFDLALIDGNQFHGFSSGDTVVQGRFGNHIKLGSDSIYENPSIRIVTGQSQTLPNVQLKNVDSKFVQMEDINNDGSSIYMTSGPEQMSPPLVTAAPTHNFPQQKYLYGNQIILNSDRLVFQAKGVVYPGSNADLDISPTGCIHMLAADDFIISSGDRVVIEVPQPQYNDKGNRTNSAGIFLGWDADTSGTGVAKGAEVIETLKDMMTVIEDIITEVSGVQVAVGVALSKSGKPKLSFDEPLKAINGIKRQCKLIREYLPDIESKTVITSFD